MGFSLASRFRGVIKTCLVLAFLFFAAVQTLHANSEYSPENHGYNQGIWALLGIPYGQVVDVDVDTSTPENHTNFVGAGSDQFAQEDWQAFGAEPEYLVSRAEQISSARLTRISDDWAFANVDGRPTHQYSRRQAWNTNMSMIEVGNAVLDAHDYRIIVPEIQLSTARVWSRTNPQLMYGIYFGPEPNVVASWNVLTGALDRLMTLSDHTDCSFGNQEGNPSTNEKVIVACDHKYNGEKHLIALDLRNRVQLGVVQQEWNYNWAGYSDSGDYIIVENNASGAPSSLIRYDANFQNPLPLGRSSHGDFGRDADNGGDIYAMIKGDGFEMIRLSDGFRQYLSLSGVSGVGNGHLSCRSVERSGWCYFSSYGVGGKLGAVRFSFESPDIEIWGFHRSSSDAYPSQPKATVSPDGRKILFTSDWYGYGQTTDYVLEID